MYKGKTLLKILAAPSTIGKHGSKALQILESTGAELVQNQTGNTLNGRGLLNLARGCQAIVAGTEQYSTDVIDALTDLRVISRCGTGTDSIDFEATEKNNIIVCTTPGGPAQAVAELTLAFILNLIRYVGVSDRALRGGTTCKRVGYLLGELTVGIIGLGHIGRAVAQLIKPFGASIVAFDIQPDEIWSRENRVRLLKKDEVIRSADVLTLHIPYEKSLHHCIDEQQLMRMKRGAFLINVSRGGLVDEDALYNVLIKGHLSGAAIDTFEHEPYDGKLRKLPQVILSPHVGSYARACRVAMEEEAARNLVTALKRLGYP